MKEELNKWRDIPFSWIGRLNFVKISVLPKIIYIFSTSPINIPESFFVDIAILILKFIWRGGRLKIASDVRRERERDWRRKKN